MNKVIAEIRIENIYNSFIHISKSPQMHNYGGHYDDEGIDTLLNQGFVWYQDFISFYMLSDYQAYWVKIAVSESLEIDSIIANAETLGTDNPASVILLPFQTTGEEQIYVFGDYDKDVILSFTLPAGHYQLLFQNRYFTREEIEAEPNFNCQDLDYDSWEHNLELCLLTFIPTDAAIEPKILAYQGGLESKEYSEPSILYKQKLYESDDG